jgi:hypothetical protein
MPGVKRMTGLGRPKIARAALAVTVLPLILAGLAVAGRAGLAELALATGWDPFALSGANGPLMEIEFIYGVLFALGFYFAVLVVAATPLFWAVRRVGAGYALHIMAGAAAGLIGFLLLPLPAILAEPARAGLMAEMGFFIADFWPAMLGAMAGLGLAGYLFHRVADR